MVDAIYLLTNNVQLIKILISSYICLYSLREKDRLKDRDDKWNKVSALAKSNPEVRI